VNPDSVQGSYQKVGYFLRDLMPQGLHDVSAHLGGILLEGDVKKLNPIPD
jgi:hypothetical protein